MNRLASPPTAHDRGRIRAEQAAPKALEAPAGWPTLDPAALHGPAGELVNTLAPHTEADPAALLVATLTCVGSMVGGGPGARVGGAHHPGRLFVAVVGDTSRSRKGTAFTEVRRVLERVDPAWADRIVGGFGSGEAVIDAVRDPDDDEERPPDRRLLVREPELARVLNVAKRDGSTLSPIIREAWDGGPLAVRSRRGTVTASGAHVSVLADITEEELRRALTETEVANGWGNRFLWLAARRSKLLPSGGDLTDDDLNPLVSRLRHRVEGFRRFTRFERGAEAEGQWGELYARMAGSDLAGMAGALTARAEAQVLRLSVLYAGLDGTDDIGTEHLDAASAVWQYAEDSVRYLFGDETGDPIADRLLEALRQAGADGLTGAQQHDLFSRHKGERLQHARELLETLGLAHTETEKTGGRPRTITYASE